MKKYELNLLILLAFVGLVSLSISVLDLERRERDDRELIAFLTHNQELTTDVLKLRGGGSSMKLWQLINAVRDGLLWGLVLGTLAVGSAMMVLHIMEGGL